MSTLPNNPAELGEFRASVKIFLMLPAMAVTFDAMGIALSQGEQPHALGITMGTMSP